MDDGVSVMCDVVRSREKAKVSKPHRHLTRRQCLPCSTYGPFLVTLDALLFVHVVVLVRNEVLELLEALFFFNVTLSRCCQSSLVDDSPPMGRRARMETQNWNKLLTRTGRVRVSKLT